MQKYVVWVKENNQKVYCLVRDGVSSFVSNPAEATILPNRFVASCVVKAIKPAIKKNNLSVDVGFECVDDCKSSGSPDDK